MIELPFSKNKSKLSQLLIAIIIIFLVLSCNSQAAKSNSLKILLPLYIYPNWYEPDNYVWSDVVSAAKQVSIVAIINPNNGPDGQPPNQDYARGLKDLKQANITILGYVYTKYGDRPLAEVKRDIDLYYAHFGVKGIFLDESASHVQQIAYYQQIYHYIKAKGNQNQVVINPGTHTDRAYLTRPAADTAVIFEDFFQAWIGYKPPAYVDQINSKHFASLIHSVPDAATMKSYIDLAVKRNFGYIYVTDDSPTDSDGDPWNSLPSYWQEEVDYIQSLP